METMNVNPANYRPRRSRTSASNRRVTGVESLVGKLKDRIDELEARIEKLEKKPVAKKAPAKKTATKPQE